MLAVLVTPGGELELRTLRCRLHTSKANATEISTRSSAAAWSAAAGSSDRRAAVVAITPPGQELLKRLFPEHSSCVARAFAPLDDDEMRTLVELCRRLAAT